MTPDRPSGPLVVGVDLDQDASVLRTAASLASTMGAELVCVWVDGSRMPADGEGPAGTGVPLDPDAVESDGATEIAAQVHAVLGVHAPEVVRVGGEVASGLADAAEPLDATAIVVGARRPGVRGWLDEAVSGSVAGRLAHTQERPVIVVPQGRAE